MYLEGYLETKIKPCEGKFNTTFHDARMPKEDS